MENRRSPRYNVEAPAILRVDGRAGPFLVTVLDVSESGVRVNSPTAFVSGTLVTLTCRGSTVSGEIRYTRSVDSGFHVGILANSASDGARSESGEMDLTRLFKHMR